MHPMTSNNSRYLSVLKKYFGFNSLRGSQHDAVNAVLAGKDLLLTAPTGHGKSLCFQLPALVHHTDPFKKGSVSVVITPLVSLMQNQVAALKARNIPCALLSSAETDASNQKVLASLSAKHPPFALLYITPEKLVTQRFMSAMRELHSRQKLALLAVDEAHCISQWGHDFRKAYASLGVVKHNFPNLPVIALTATATTHVRRDIITSLKIQDALQIQTSFLRDNIRYECRYTDALPLSVEADIESYIKRRRLSDGSFQKGIVYAFKTDTVDFLAKFMQQKGIPTTAYHGKMTPNQRKASQSSFESGVTPVIVASTAFGMGIDVAAIRFVIHHSIPKTVEAFYQESGRAGRDRKPADSVLYYSERDANYMMFLGSKHLEEDDKRSSIALEGMKAMKLYCAQVKCRRVHLLQYFGEKASAKDICGPLGCDVCHDRKDVVQRMCIKVKLQTGTVHSGRRGATTPAADFQTARSMMKLSQQEKEVERKKVEKRPRSILEAEDIDDSSSDEKQVKVKRKVDELLSHGKADVVLRALALAEEADEVETASRLKRPRRRLLGRLGAATATVPVLTKTVEKRRGSLGRVGFRRASHSNSHEAARYSASQP